MNIWQLIQSKGPESMLGRTSLESQANILGRVFQARVLEQLNGALFSIQNGTVTSKSIILGKVEVGKEYLFQVKKGPEGLYLIPTDKMPAITRTLPSQVEKDTAGVPAARPSQLSSPLQTTHERLQAMLTPKGESIPPTAIKHLVGMIDPLPAIEKERAMEMLKLLVNRTGVSNIPEKLQMVLSGFSEKEKVLQVLAKIEADIQKAASPTPVQQKLVELIQQMQQSQTLHTKAEAIHFIRQVVSLLGLDFERGLSEMIRHNQPLSEVKMEQLKPLLMNYLQQVETSEEKSAITQLLTKLTGFQLLSREEGNLHHLFMPIPIKMNEEAKEWYVHISSKKKEDMLDPDYCRIVIFLDLPVFSSVMVDVFVQQKVVNLSLQHSYPGMELLLQNGTALLKKSLSAKGFTLSSVKAERKEQEEPGGMAVDFFKKILIPTDIGVDIKI